MKYRFRDCELDVGARTVTRAGAPVRVEPQVFDLILYLIENRGRVVDKDELLARVWKGRLVSDATIASRINAARTALGDDGRAQAVIATAARTGFRFVAEVSEEGGGIGRPVVAVMPFDLLSQDAADAHLARGLADQLATTLGQAAWLDIIDTAASFSGDFAGRSPAEIAARLGADYLVMGSLQATAGELKLSVRLIDPETARSVWSGAFGGPRGEVFRIQDDMALRLLGEIEPRLRRTELQHSAGRHGNFTAFDHYLRAVDTLSAMDLPAMLTACTHLDKAVESHPGYAAAHAMRAWISTLMLPQGRRVDETAEKARCRMALSEGAFDCDALSMAGYALGFFERDPATGIGYLRRALAINPSAARAHDHLGWLLLYAGEAERAFGHFDRGLALCPVDEFGFRMLTGRAFARLFRTDYAGAAEDARRAHAAAPGYTVCHRVLIAALAHLGREREAGAALRELLAINPGLSLAKYGRETRFDGVRDREILMGGLRKAGMR